jgi:hypothetical protein
MIYDVDVPPESLLTKLIQVELKGIGFLGLSSYSSHKNRPFPNSGSPLYPWIDRLANQMAWLKKCFKRKEKIGKNVFRKGKSAEQKQTIFRNEIRTQTFSGKKIRTTTKHWKSEKQQNIENQNNNKHWKSEQQQNIENQNNNKTLKIRTTTKH